MKKKRERERERERERMSSKKPFEEEVNNIEQRSLILFRMGLFAAAHGWRQSEKVPCP